MQSIRRWLGENSLSTVFFALFVASIAGQSVTGLTGYNDVLQAHGRPPIRYGEYLVTGDFLSGIFSNWQAAVLQLGCLIVFSTVLRQKGASHSLRPTHPPDEAARKSRENRHASWLYRHSLSLAFAGLFAGSFTAHVVFGTWAYNETRALGGQSPVSIASYVTTGTFWTRTLQTWEAEFVAIWMFVFLSIHLREQGSAESKPIESRDDETGVTNE